MAWVEAATLDDLPAGASLEFESRGTVYALFRSPDGDVITCLDGLCPHNSGRLASGPFDGSTVTCPRRGCLRWSFDVRTGASTVGEPIRLRLHPVRLDGRSILVALLED